MRRSQWATVLEAQGPPGMGAPQDQVLPHPTAMANLGANLGTPHLRKPPWPGQPGTPATFIYLS